MIDRIYFAASDGHIKIGLSRDVARRLNGIQTNLPQALGLIGSIAGSVDLEKLIHGELAPYKIRGEWFRDCEDVRSYIANKISGPTRDWIFVQRKPSIVREQADPSVRVLLELAKQRWPERTDEGLAECAGVSSRAARYWLRGQVLPSGIALRRIESFFTSPDERRSG